MRGESQPMPMKLGVAVLVTVWQYGHLNFFQSPAAGAVRTMCR